MMLVLSLFPGIGLLDCAFDAEGFCVVRGPDLLWGGDVRKFHPPEGRFDGVIGGPPCQAFSALVHINRSKGYTVAPNLIPEFERCVNEARPRWFLMENVPDAPLPTVPGYAITSALVCDADVGGRTSRLRRFSFGVLGDVTPCFEVETMPRVGPPAQAVLASGGHVTNDGQLLHKLPAVTKAGRQKQRGRRSDVAYFEAAKRLQGLPDDFDLPGFTAAEKVRAIGNGVPFAMGRAVARTVTKSLDSQKSAE